jgi:hypothetical protein
MNTTTCLTLSVLTLIWSVACSNDSSSNDEPNDNTGGSTSVRGGSGGQTHASGGSSGNVGGASAAGGTRAAPVSDPTGFSIRIPTSHTLTCNDGSTESFDDTDWICSFAYGGKTGTVYIQSTPTSCKVIMSAQATFTTDLAQIAIDGKLTNVEGAAYDWGGNHRNDMLTFSYGGNTYDYYHSSFGFGWRKCQNMDCLQVSVGSTGSVTEDGCASTRTLPAVCSQIQKDGTYDSLSADSFAKCVGDPNA